MLHKLTQGDPADPVFVYYLEPFSVSPYYDFLDAFLLGLNLDTFFQGS